MTKETVEDSTANYDDVIHTSEAGNAAQLEGDSEEELTGGGGWGHRFG